VDTRAVATLASAPTPATKPDHNSRFMRGLSAIGADSIRLGGGNARSAPTPRVPGRSFPRSYV
jgi:hypothetical protein